MPLISNKFPIFFYICLALWQVWGGIFAHNLALFDIMSPVDQRLSKYYRVAFDDHLMATALYFSAGIFAGGLLSMANQKIFRFDKEAAQESTWNLVPLILFVIGLGIKFRHDVGNLDWKLFFSLNFFQIFGLLFAYPKSGLSLKIIIYLIIIIDFLIGHRATFLFTTMCIVIFHLRNVSFFQMLVLVTVFTLVGLFGLDLYSSILDKRPIDINSLIFTRLSLSHVSIMIYELMSTYPDSAFTFHSEFFPESAFFILDSGQLFRYIDWMPSGTGVTMLAQLSLSDGFAIPFGIGLLLPLCWWIILISFGHHGYWLWPLNFLLVERIGDSILGFIILFSKFAIPLALVFFIHSLRLFFLARKS